MVGVDYTRFIRSIVQPSLEVRVTGANGTVVNEHTYTGGLKLQTTVHRIHPYATFLVGYGVIDLNYFNGGYNHDNSVIYSLGGGADFDVTSLLKVRLDATHQNWNLGGSDGSLTPVTFSVGVAYSLPFHSGRVRFFAPSPQRYCAASVPALRFTRIHAVSPEDATLKRLGDRNR